MTLKPPPLEGLSLATEKMTQAGISHAAVEVFRHYWSLLASGDTGLIGEEEIEPVTELAHVNQICVSDDEEAEALSATAVIRLNGGLGTSMGLDKAKNLLEVRHGLTFLDLIVRQVLAVRQRSGAKVPLLLMNSFRTRDDSLEFLNKYPSLQVDGLPLDFVQSAEPKLDADTLAPISWEANPNLEWCPPGHGDIFPALQASGVIEK